MPPWLRRLVRAVRLALPVIAVALPFLNSGAARSRSAAAALVELPYSSFLTLVRDDPSRITQLRISLTRLSFLLVQLTTYCMLLPTSHLPLARPH